MQRNIRAPDEMARISGSADVPERQATTGRLAMTRGEAAHALGIPSTHSSGTGSLSSGSCGAGSCGSSPCARLSAGWRKTLSGRWGRVRLGATLLPRGEDMAERLPEGISLRHARSCPGRSGWALPLHTEHQRPPRVAVEPDREEQRQLDVAHPQRVRLRECNAEENGRQSAAASSSRPAAGHGGRRTGHDRGHDDAVRDPLHAAGTVMRRPSSWSPHAKARPRRREYEDRQGRRGLASRSA
jgi:hypothetical protein